MKKGLAALLLAIVVVSCRTNAANLEDGLRAYNQNRVGEAEAIFKRVADDPALPPHDRATALRALARISWLIDGKEEQAVEALNRAAAVAEPCDAARMRARILDEAERVDELVSHSAGWLSQCPDRQAKDEIHYHVADALLAAADRSPSRSALLERARAELSAISPDDRSDSHVAAAQLEVAIMQGDAKAAVEAWKDYYWLTDGDGPQAFAEMSPRPSARISVGLAPDASAHDQLLLIDLMTHAGFAETAERLARHWNVAVRAAGDPIWRKAAAYLEERRKLEAIVLASNRRVARGGQASNLRQAVQSMQAALANAAGIKGDLRREIARAYGLYGTVGKTGGFESVHLGHLVQSDRVPIVQYGHRTAVSYLVIDNLISNGYKSWLWDGDATDGGWTEAGPVIVQARPGYTRGPLDAWSLVADPQHRREYLARQPRLDATDRAALRSAEVAYLPGLAHRLNLQVAGQVLARARSQVGRGHDLHRAYLAEYSRANLQQSILIHEGRHALDLDIIPGTSVANRAELEYRAKLSELALADYPRLALMNIDGATIDGDNEHGRANRRIMAHYASWIRTHASEVRGYDRSSPALAQLDLLSDKQIRAVASALDPFAR
jgi:hypothetical protein